MRLDAVALGVGGAAGEGGGGGGSGGGYLALCELRTHAEGQRDFVGLPLPPHCVPLSVSQARR